MTLPSESLPKALPPAAQFTFDVELHGGEPEGRKAWVESLHPDSWEAGVAHLPGGVTLHLERQLLRAELPRSLSEEEGLAWLDRLAAHAAEAGLELRIGSEPLADPERARSRWREARLASEVPIPVHVPDGFERLRPHARLGFLLSLSLGALALWLGLRGR